MSLTDHHHVQEIEITSLRPTQITVGLAEVAEKRKQWSKLGKRERRAHLASHCFPAVIGPRRRCHIVDHHHLGLALHQEGVERVNVRILSDLSYLALPVFWRVMEQRNWAHPFDAMGERRPFDDIPGRVTRLVDDPYRSLAGFLRNAGGYAKDASPFAEFLWADYLRPLITREQIEASMPNAVREAIGLAHSPLARYLPGWTGVAPPVTDLTR